MLTDPLAAILPAPVDRAAWSPTGTTVAADTRATVVTYEHHATGRRLRLDAGGRVYGQDAEGVVRLFGRGGPLALAVALNVVFDGADALRPSRVVLPDAGAGASRSRRVTANSP